MRVLHRNHFLRLGVYHPSMASAMRPTSAAFGSTFLNLEAIAASSAAMPKGQPVALLSLSVCLVFGSLILLAQAVPARAQSTATPDLSEVVVSLRCPASPCRFHQGEVIHLELYFTAAKAGYAVQDGRQVGDGLSLRSSGRESFTATPSDCVGDPLEGSTIMMNGSGIFGTPPLLAGEPFFPPFSVEINQWIRFGCTGKYQITARSTRCYWKANQAVAFQHPQALVSTPMDIEIVPADAEWQREELARILPELPSPGAPWSARATAAVRALAYLGSDDALREIRRRISDEPFTSDFRQQNYPYLLEWEMARLELLRHESRPPIRR